MLESQRLSDTIRSAKSSFRNRIGCRAELRKRNNMPSDHATFRLPQEEYKKVPVELLASWTAWSLRWKRSKQSLLDDSIGIDPVIQKHMTICATSNTEDVILPQYQYQSHKLDYKNRYIIKKEFQVDNVHRTTKHHRVRFQDQLSRVAKVRRLNYHKSTTVPSYHNNDGNRNNDTQYTFWRNLNVLTGSIHGKTFDLTH